MSLMSSLLECVRHLHESDEMGAGRVKCVDCGEMCSEEHVCPDCHRCAKCQESYAPKGELTEMAKIADNGTKVNCPNVSFPPVVACKHDAPCRGGNCYACASVARFKGFAENVSDNYAQWLEDPKGFEGELDGYLQYKHPGRFRYNVSGDVPDEAYLAMIARLADKHPGTKFLVYSKKHDLDLAKYRRDNLAVVRSMWPGWGTPDADHPQAWFKPLPHKGTEPRIPEGSFECPCGPDDPGCGVPFPDGREPCVKCWDAKPGDNIVFNEHGKPTDVEGAEEAPEGKHNNWKKMINRFGADSLKPTHIVDFKQQQARK